MGGLEVFLSNLRRSQRREMMKDLTVEACEEGTWVSNETVVIASHDLAHGVGAGRADELGFQPVVVAFWVHGQISLAVRVI